MLARLKSTLFETTLLLFQSESVQEIAAWRSDNKTITIVNQGSNRDTENLKLPHFNKNVVLPTWKEAYDLRYTGSKVVSIVAQPHAKSQGSSQVYSGNTWLTFGSEKGNNIVGAYSLDEQIFVVSNRGIFSFRRGKLIEKAKLSKPSMLNSFFYWSERRHLFALADSTRFSVYDTSGKCVSSIKMHDEILGLAECTESQFAVVTTSSKLILEDNTSRKIDFQKDDPTFGIMAIPTANGEYVGYAGQLGQFWMRKVK